MSNGGLNAPLGDMALYLGFLLGSSDKKAAYEEILKRSSLEEMWQPQVPVPDEGGASVALGLSYFLERRFGLDLVAHSGTQNGFLSHFFAHVPSRTAYIVAYNTQAGGEEASEPAPDGVEHEAARHGAARLPDPAALCGRDALARRATSRSGRGRSRARRGSRRTWPPPSSWSCGG